MIIETLITTENADGSMHVSAIGPEVNEELSQWRLKPFKSSTTFRNLQHKNRCVIHITDNALLLAKVVSYQAADVEAKFIDGVGYLLANTCRAYALKIDNWDIRQDRAVANAHVFWHRELRPFWGWNRAKHGLLELAVNATRVSLLDEGEILGSIQNAKTLVQKTGGASEHDAIQMLEEFVLRQLAAKGENR